MRFLLFLILIFGPSSARAGDDASRLNALQSINRVRKYFDQQKFLAPPDLSKKNSVHTEEVLNEATPFKPRGAGGCASKNFAKKMGPLRNQGGLGWCFASVTADLLSAASGKRVSDIDLALQYFRFQPGRKVNSAQLPLPEDASTTHFWSGFIGEAFNVGSKLGVCTEDEVASANFIFSERVAESMLEKTDFPVEDLITKGTLQSIEELAGMNITEMLSQEADTCSSIQSAQLLFPKLNTWQIISSLSTAQTREEALHGLIRQSCQRKPVALNGRKFVDILARGKGPYGGIFFPHLDKYLNKEQPVALGIDMKQVFAETKNNPDVEKAMHAVTVVGREFRGGECKYLIRNSTGPNCTQFADPYNRKENCSQGQFWIGEKALNQAISYMGVVK